MKNVTLQFESSSIFNYYNLENYLTEYQFDEKIDLLKASLNRNGIHFRVRLTRLTKAKVTLCSSEPVGNSKH